MLPICAGADVRPTRLCLKMTVGLSTAPLGLPRSLLVSGMLVGDVTVSEGRVSRAVSYLSEWLRSAAYWSEREMSSSAVVGSGLLRFTSFLVVSLSRANRASKSSKLTYWGVHKIKVTFDQPLTCT